MNTFRTFNKPYCKYHPMEELLDDYKAGDMVCRICGLVVVARVIDPSSEWRSFANDDGVDNCRVGAVEDNNYVDGQTSITIANKNNPKFLNENGKSKYAAYSTMSAEERFSKTIVAKIRCYSSTLEMNSIIIDDAIKVCKEFKEKSKGKKERTNCDVLAAVGIFIACRKQKILRSLKDILNETGLEQKPVLKMVKKVTRTLGIRFQNSVNLNDIWIYCQKLNIRDNRIKKMVEKLMILKFPELNTKNELSLVGGAIYAACLWNHFNIEAKKISDSLQVSEAQIKSVFKVFAKHRKDVCT